MNYDHYVMEQWEYWETIATGNGIFEETLSAISVNVTDIAYNIVLVFIYLYFHGLLDQH